MKLSKFSLIAFFLITVPASFFLYCGSSGSGNSGNSGVTYDDITITTDTVWENTDIHITGKIVVASGATLTLKNVKLYFNPDIEDTTTFEVNGGTVIATDSSIQSESGKQWNLEAVQSSKLSFTRTKVTNHSGLRAHDSTILTADASAVEEIQCHDNAKLIAKNGSGVYVVLFFDNAGAIAFAHGAIAAGEGITKSFTYKSSDKATGSVSISDSDVWGYQLDLTGSTNLSVTDGIGLVLALHLADTGTKTITGNITSSFQSSGSFDMSSSGNPSFTWTDSQIDYLNTYVDGTSDVTFSGTNRVVECNVLGDAKLTFGSGTSLCANLAQSYDNATLTLDGVTLISDDSVPSFTAQGTSTINIKNVKAVSGTMVYAVESGTVNITGGTGWDDSMFDEYDSGKINH